MNFNDYTVTWNTDTIPIKDSGNLSSPLLLGSLIEDNQVSGVLGSWKGGALLHTVESKASEDLENIPMAIIQIQMTQ
jgi:hypothetical protein